MMVKRICGTEGFLPKNGGKAGTMTEASFLTLEAAKAAPLPAGCVAALIHVDDGRHVYSANWGWEFFPKEQPVFPPWKPS